MRVSDIWNTRSAPNRHFDGWRVITDYRTAWQLVRRNWGGSKLCDELRGKEETDCSTGLWTKHVCKARNRLLAETKHTPAAVQPCLFVSCFVDGWSRLCYQPGSLMGLVATSKWRETRVMLVCFFSCCPYCYAGGLLHCNWQLYRLRGDSTQARTADPLARVRERTVTLTMESWTTNGKTRNHRDRWVLFFL